MQCSKDVAEKRAWCQSEDLDNSELNATKRQKLRGKEAEENYDFNEVSCAFVQKPPAHHIGKFDIETDQSCRNQGLHKSILLATEYLIGERKFHVGYDCINKFCNDVFCGTNCVRKTEWFLGHYGSELDFLSTSKQLYRQQKYKPDILQRGNKVVLMRVGNCRVRPNAKQP